MDHIAWLTTIAICLTIDHMSFTCHSVAVARPQFCYMSSVDGALTVTNSRPRVRITIWYWPGQDKRQTSDYIGAHATCQSCDVHFLRERVLYHRMLSFIIQPPSPPLRPWWLLGGPLFYWTSTTNIIMISPSIFMSALFVYSCSTHDHCDMCWTHCTSWSSCWWSFSLLESGI